MSNLFEWDELNLIREEARRLMSLPKEKRKEARDTFCDYLEFVLCLVYAYGWKDAEEIVGIVPFKDGLDDKAVNLDIDHKTFRDRVDEQIEDGDEAGMLRIIDTESHRDYNTGVYDAAVESGTSPMKRWSTMLDNNVRDTHQFLEGITVGLDDYFYSPSGAMAKYPGGFGDPTEDCNCRCYITLVGS